MTRFAIDPPTLLRLVEEDVEVDPKHQLVAPNLIRSQALDLLLARVQSGEMSESSAIALHERMTELKMRLLGDRVSRRTAWKIALANGWTTIQDAEYLAVTILQADFLIATNLELAKKAGGVVALANFEDLNNL